MKLIRAVNFFFFLLSNSFTRNTIFFAIGVQRKAHSYHALYYTALLLRHHNANARIASALIILERRCQIDTKRDVYDEKENSQIVIESLSHSDSGIKMRQSRIQYIQ